MAMPARGTAPALPTAKVTITRPNTAAVTAPATLAAVSEAVPEPGADAPCDAAAGARGCCGVSAILDSIGDKWTVQVVGSLRAGPRRFNDIKRSVAGISQQMLTRTLKGLERDGLVQRTVFDTKPPKVEYALTALGCSLSGPLHHLAEWASAHLGAIDAHRQRYDAEQAER